MADKWVHVVGARPQFIKLGPIVRAAEGTGADGSTGPPRQVVVHTGQHYDPQLSRRLFDDLDLPRPDHQLDAGSGPHGRQTARMLARLEAVLDAERPDVALVYGDTNSTLAGALAAAKLGIPIAHVEAGLRSFDRSMPEEINRVLTDRIAELLLCPTETAIANLRREGIEDGVHLVGDVMYDAVLQNRAIARERSGALRRLALDERGYVLATIHRAANTDDPERLAAILRGLDEIARDLPVVMPLHPRTRNALEAAGLRAERARLIEPAGYLDMLELTAGARSVVTDSGGVQKEALMLEVPCVTVRDATEWPETVATGWNVLVPAEPDRIARAVRNASPGAKAAPFGDGRAADKIVRIVRDSTGTTGGRD